MRRWIRLGGLLLGIGLLSGWSVGMTGFPLRDSQRLCASDGRQYCLQGSGRRGSVFRRASVHLSQGQFRLCHLSSLCRPCACLGVSRGVTREFAMVSRARCGQTMGIRSNAADVRLL